MAFKMKLGSKNLDGLYSINNKQTDAIKSGSGGLGMAGQVPDGPGNSGMAMNDSGMYMKDSGMYQRGGKDEFGTTIPDMSSGGDNEVTGTLNKKDITMNRTNTVKGKKVGDDYNSNEDIRDGSGNQIKQKVTKVKTIPKKSQTQTKVEKPDKVEITRKAGSVKFT
jgi:hypothetical protein